MKKRLLALFVAVMLLATLFAGCTKAPAADDVKDPAQSGDQNAPAPEKREDVTLTILMHGGTTTSGVQDDAVTKAVQEKLGITMDIITTSGMDLDTTLNAMIASEDVPDIVVAVTPQQGRLLLESEAIIPLNDLVAEYAPHIQASKNAQAGMYLNREYTYVTESGEDYFIPVLSGNNYIAGTPQVAANIRWDIYEKIGMPEVSSLDDLLDVLKQMQDAYPETEDGRKVYAISGSLADGAWNNWSLTAIEAAIGVRRVHNGGLVYLSTADPTQIINGYEGEDAPTWRLFKLFNKAYQMGILDPDAATMMHDQYWEKLMTGTALYCPFDLTGAYVNEDPGQYFLPVAFSEFENDSFTCSYANSAGQFNYAISATCEHPERAMELLDFIWSSEGAYLFANGSEQGGNWDLVDGQPQLKPEYVEGVNAGTIEGPLFANFIGEYVNPETGTPYNLTATDYYYSEYRTTDATKAYCEKYGVDSPLENFTKAEHYIFDTAWQLALPALEGDLKDKSDAIQEYALTNLTKMVFAKSDAEFEAMRQEFMETVNEMGAQEVFAFYAENYSARAAEMAEYLG